MRNKLGLLAIIALAAVMLFTACNRKTPGGEAAGIGNRQNPHYGKIFRDKISDIPELEISGEGNETLYECRNLGFRFCQDNNGNSIVVFFEITERDEEGRAIRKILDIINLGKTNDNESLFDGGFEKDGEFDRELFGIITNVSFNFYNEEMFGEIDRVWRADRNTGIISPVDITGLRFFYNLYIELQPPPRIKMPSLSFIGTWGYEYSYLQIENIYDTDIEFFWYDGEWFNISTRAMAIIENNKIVFTTRDDSGHVDDFVHYPVRGTMQFTPNRVSLIVEQSQHPRISAGQRFNYTFRDDDSVSYFVNMDEGTSGEEVYPVIALYEDNTFSMTVNLLAGMGTLSGTYQINGNTYSFNVLDIGFSGFSGDDVTSFTMIRNSDGALIYNGPFIGTTLHGSIFVHSVNRPVSFIAR